MVLPDQTDSTQRLVSSPKDRRPPMDFDGQNILKADRGPRPSGSLNWQTTPKEKIMQRNWTARAQWLVQLSNVKTETRSQRLKVLTTRLGSSLKREKSLARCMIPTDDDEFKSKTVPQIPKPVSSTAVSARPLPKRSERYTALKHKASQRLYNNITVSASSSGCLGQQPASSSSIKNGLAPGSSHSKSIIESSHGGHTLLSHGDENGSFSSTSKSSRLAMSLHTRKTSRSSAAAAISRPGDRSKSVDPHGMTHEVPHCCVTLLHTPRGTTTVISSSVKATEPESYAESSREVEQCPRCFDKRHCESLSCESHTELSLLGSTSAAALSQTSFAIGDDSFDGLAEDGLVFDQARVSAKEPVTYEESMPDLGDTSATESLQPTSSTNPQILQQLTDQMRNTGLEVLKLGKRNIWQPRVLTVSRESIGDAGNCGHCPKALLWLKTHPSKPGSVSSIRKNGRGGMFLFCVRHITLVPQGMTPPIPCQFSKYKLFAVVLMTYTFNGVDRSIQLAFKSQPDADKFISWMREIEQLIGDEEE
jgi:hypothetical protein